MKSAHDMVMKLLGGLLLAAAALKAWQLLTEPTADSGFWTTRWVLIAQVEGELLLGGWLLSGLFKKTAWLAALLCFGCFSIVTL